MKIFKMFLLALVVLLLFSIIGPAVYRMFTDNASMRNRRYIIQIKEKVRKDQEIQSSIDDFEIYSPSLIFYNSSSWGRSEKVLLCSKVSSLFSSTKYIITLGDETTIVYPEKDCVEMLLNDFDLSYTHLPEEN